MRPRLHGWIAFGLAGMAGAAGAYMSIRAGDWSHFARSGAVIVIIGAIVTTWDSLRAGNSVVLMLRHALSRERMPLQALGLCLMVLGTLIWAFGDFAAWLAP